MIITEEVKKGMEICPDFLDFPTAWAIQNTMNEHVKHDSKCSSVEGSYPLAGSCFLCDCGGLEELYNKIKQ